ncbi:hypothetical protein Taro_001407 [Colocasia esculenta]|uniref:Uncharacterized protein n=1 Tax=Colocasia esculenta TaxID=4460 RepID=A0A843T9Z0_COLES|nr:hypothetical protein [Colocasia esculenta]
MRLRISSRASSTLVSVSHPQNDTRLLHLKDAYIACFPAVRKYWHFSLKVPLPVSMEKCYAPSKPGAHMMWGGPCLLTARHVERRSP